jgi:fatty acid desaturase
MGVEEMRGSGGSAPAIPAAANFSLAAMHLLLSIYLFFLLPLFLLPLSPRWSLTILPVVLFSNPFWSLIHEAIHDMFHASARINRGVGRALSIFFGSPFRVLRLSHLLHHKLNRTPMEATELFDPERTSRLRASPGYYFYILGGLYLYEVFSPLPFFLPRKIVGKMERRYFTGDDLAGSLVRSLMTGESVREMRADGALILALFGLSALCYGAWWPLLLAALMARAFLISFLDNVYHYRTAVNDVFYADNLRLPRLLARMLLHFNLHGVHHRNTTVTWIRLPEVFERGSGKFAGDYFAAAVRQLRGPVALSDLPRRRPVANG